MDHAPILSVPLFPTVRMFGKAFISFGVVVVIVLAIAIYRHVRDNRDAFDRRRFLILISPVLIPIVWFELLSNHTQTPSALHLSQCVGRHRDHLRGRAAGERTADDAAATHCGPAPDTA